MAYNGKPCIYRIQNQVSGTFYVGSTNNFKKRKWEHLRDLEMKRHVNLRLQRSWDKHGRDAFSFEILEEIEDVTQLVYIEETYLMRLTSDPLCCNFLQSAFSSPSLDPRIREKIGATLRKRFTNTPWEHPRFDKKHSEETKAKISAAKKANPSKYWEGKERDEATKTKISASQKGVSKAPRVYTPEGLERAKETMRRNAREQAPLPFDAVLAKFPEEVKSKYDFTNAVYTGALERITECICPVHGVFSQYAAQFRKGSGCPSCGAEARSVSKRKQMLGAWSSEEGRNVFMGSRKKRGPVAP